MNINNRLFTYPILNDSSFDYEQSYFRVKMEHKMDGIDTLSLRFSIDMKSDYLRKMILSGYAEYLIHIECPTTSYREVIRSLDTTIHKNIPISRLNGKVEIVAFLIAKKRIRNFTCDEWIEDYDDISFDIEKGSILAFENIEDLMITKDFEEFISSKSIVTIFKLTNKDKKYMDIELESHKIRIGLPEKDFNTYKKIAGNINYQEIINSMIVFPALVYTFEELKQQDSGLEKYESRNWCMSLQRAYEKQGLDFTEELYRSDKKSLTLAQEVMNDPLNTGFNQLLQTGAWREEEDD